MLVFIFAHIHTAHSTQNGTFLCFFLHFVHLITCKKAKQTDQKNTPHTIALGLLYVESKSEQTNETQNNTERTHENRVVNMNKE